MTWQPRDAMPAKKIGDGLVPPTRSSSAEEPASGHLAPPVPLPTYAQAAAYLTPDDEDGELIRWTQQEERALMAEGIWPEREWSAWRHAMTRGIAAE